MDDAVFHVSLERLLLRVLRFRRTRCWFPAGAAIHRRIGQLVGLFILAAQDVLDAKRIEPGDPALRFVVERSQVRARNFVAPLHLLHQQFGIGDDPKPQVSVVQRPLEAGEQSRIFGDVVGRPAQVVAQLGQLVAVGALDEHSVASRTRISTRSAIAIRCHPLSTSIVGRKQAGVLPQHRASVAEGLWRVFLIGLHGPGGTPSPPGGAVARAIIYLTNDTIRAILSLP